MKIDAKVIRKRNKSASLFIFTLIIGAFIFFGKPNAKNDQAEKIMNQEAITIKSGADGNSNIKPQGFDVMNHPSGVYAYTKKWNDPSDLGVVKFSHGKNSFEINNVFILTGLGDNGFPENGVDNWSLMLRLGPEKTDSYEEARSKIMSLLSRLRAAGWKRYIEVSDPRLSGRDAVLYELSDPGQTYSLDSTYVPTIEEWKQLVTVEPVWEFYANEVFVSLTISYWASAIPNTGRYLVNIKINTATDNYSPCFSDDDDDKKRQWKKYLSEKLAPAREARGSTEAKLDPHKYTIDTTYQEPPFEAPDFSAQSRSAH